MWLEQSRATVLVRSSVSFRVSLKWMWRVLSVGIDCATLATPVPRLDPQMPAHPATSEAIKEVLDSLAGDIGLNACANFGQSVRHIDL